MVVVQPNADCRPKRVLLAFRWVWKHFVSILTLLPLHRCWYCGYSEGIIVNSMDGAIDEFLVSVAVRERKWQESRKPSRVVQTERGCVQKEKI